jgi:hypothetical protein
MRTLVLSPGVLISSGTLAQPTDGATAARSHEGEPRGETAKDE